MNVSKTTAAADLKKTIQQLELRQTHEWLLLKEQFLITYDSLKPLNVLKNTLREASVSIDVKDSLLARTMGLTAGYLSRVLVVGASLSPVKGVIGMLVQAGISGVVSKNPQLIKIVGHKIRNFFSKKDKIETDNS
jgi:hypothetical protein